MNNGTRLVERNNGFTLIELMIVMVIILILFAVAAPSSIQRRSSSQNKNIQEVTREADGSSKRITPAMLRRQRQETAMVLQAVEAELRDEIR